LFRIEQLYSNADGTVQFIVLHESSGQNGEHLWTGQMLTSSGGGTKSITFMTNLPGSNTAESGCSSQHPASRRSVS
jgi:hypothetical protein